MDQLRRCDGGSRGGTGAWKLSGLVEGYVAAESIESLAPLRCSSRLTRLKMEHKAAHKAARELGGYV